VPAAPPPAFTSGPRSRPVGMNRLDRHVFSRTGVRLLIVLVGINDVKPGRKLTVDDFSAAYRTIRDAAARQCRWSTWPAR
jgi:hypothetical protein